MSSCLNFVSYPFVFLSLHEKRIHRWFTQPCKPIRYSLCPRFPPNTKQDGLRPVCDNPHPLPVNLKDTMCSASFLLSANTAEWPRLGVTRTSIAPFSPVAGKTYCNEVISRFRHLCLSLFVEAASSFRSVPFLFPLLHSLQGQLLAHLALKSAMLPPLSL